MDWQNWILMIALVLIGICAMIAATTDSLFILLIDMVAMILSFVLLYIGFLK